jgi:predicted Rossmann-fold nucleotide-binding protein
MNKRVIMLCGNREEALRALFYDQREALRISLERRLSVLQDRYGSDLVVITGGATGIDSMAMAGCTRLGITFYTYPPDYDRYNARAPLVRNEEMVRRADHVIAFWDGKSRGTKNSIDHARKYRVSHEVYYFTPRALPKSSTP